MNHRLPGLESPIFIITHPETEPGQPNPPLSQKGRKEILGLKRAILLIKPGKVFSGLGRRHIETADALGLTINGFSYFLGSTVKVDDRDSDFIFLAHGQRVKRKMLDRTGLTEGLIAFLKTLPPNTILCTGRPVIRYLGLKKARSGALYRLENERLKKIS